MLVVWQLGWVDLVFQVPPVCPFALPIQPKPQQPKQTQAGSVLTQLNLLPDHQHHPVDELRPVIVEPILGALSSEVPLRQKLVK